MKLTGTQFEQLHDAFLDAFTEEELRALARVHLGEKLDVIAGGSNLSMIVFNLISWAERRGRTVELIRAAYEARPRNKTFVDLLTSLADELPAALSVPSQFEKLVVKESIRLDVARPHEVTINEPFWLAVAIMQTDSPPLSIPDLSAVDAAEGQIFRESDQPYVRYRVEIIAPDFSVAESAYVFRLEAGQNSQPKYFQLTPLTAGTLPILVNAYQVTEESEIVAQTRMELKAVVQAMDSDTRGARLIVETGSPNIVINSGQAWAVLVGINDYEDESIADLRHAVSDITAVEATIDQQFRVVRMLSDDAADLPLRANILAALHSVAQSAGEGDLLLFHFSGHGIAEQGESYLLPRDARSAALSDTSISMSRIHAIMEESAARAKVIVLDACHSGASVGKASSRMSPEFIARVFEQAEGMAVLASCKQNQQSWEWPDKRHGVFTHFLLQALRGAADLDEKGFVTVQDVGRYVTDQVRAWAAENDKPQTPTLEARMAGDILLLRHGMST